MPTIPHEYVVRGEPEAGVPPEWHDWFAEQVQELGYEGRFGGRTYVYLEHGGWKFWVIDPVINRERLPEEDVDASRQLRGIRAQ